MGPRPNDARRPAGQQAFKEGIGRVVAEAVVEFNTAIARPKNEGLTPAQAASPERPEHLRRVAAYRRRARSAAAREGPVRMTLDTLQARAKALVSERIPPDRLRQLGSLLSGCYRGAKVCV